jgi:hypothetical protein
MTRPQTGAKLSAKAGGEFGGIGIASLEEHTA